MGQEKMKLAAVVAGALFLSVGTCMADGKFYRMDGRTIPADPDLLAQAQRDLTVCRGEMARARLGSPAGRTWAEDRARNDASSAVIEGCMAERGYEWRR